MSEIAAKCNESDMILVGIGEEFQYDWDILLENKRYQEIEKKIGDLEKYQWIIPFLQKMSLECFPDDKLMKAYQNLQKLLEGKNYFIVSIAIDDFVYHYGFREDRIVTPCGGFRRMQCDDNCDGHLTEADRETYAKVFSYFKGETGLEELKEPVCGKCGRPERFNQLGVSRYAEEGYLQQWNIYMKWLQGTVNKKVCLIELGAGMRIPSIIRWPFEKIVHYNQKAFLYRVHPTLYQLGENMSGRGTGIKEKSVNFLANGFV